jgi:hypothetical protein
MQSIDLQDRRSSGQVDNPAPLDFAEPNKWHKCERPACGKLFPHRSDAPNVYCSDCGGERRGEKTDRPYRADTQNARQSKSRWSRRGHQPYALASTSQTSLDLRQLGFSGTSRQIHDQVEDALVGIRQELLLHGLGDARRRERMRERVLQFLRGLEMDGGAPLRLQGEGFALLRDIGVEGPLTPSAKNCLLDWAQRSIALFAAASEHPRYVRELVAFSILCRSCGREGQAGLATRQARDACDAYCRKSADPLVQRLRLEAERANLRLRLDDLFPATARQECRDYLKKIEDQASSVMRLTAHQEVAGLLAAKGHLEALDNCDSRIRKQELRWSSIVRVHMEVYLHKAHDEQEGKDQAYPWILKYIDCFRRDRTLHTWTMMQRWLHKYPDLFPRLPEPPAHVAYVQRQLFEDV